MSVKTKTKVGIDLDSVFGVDTDQPLVQQPKAKAKAKSSKRQKTVEFNRATVDETLSATQSIRPTKAMLDMLSRLQNISLDSDLPDYEGSIDTQVSAKQQVNVTVGRRQDIAGVKPPDLLPVVRVTPETLPAVAQSALLAAGYVSPKFHQVAALPGNIVAQIRQLGRSLFRAMTVTQTNKIYVVANLNGQGPNTNREVQAVAAWIQKYAEDLGPGIVNFDKSIPGYTAETYLYTGADITWLLVRDFAGQYIYAWPSKDSLFNLAANKNPRICRSV